MITKFEQEVGGASISATHRIVKCITSSPRQTQLLGQAFGAALTPGDFVNLVGDLGAGKTLFVKGIASALGHDPDEVSSPSFTLIREYHGEKTLFHFDLYRLDDPATQLDGLGYEEYFESVRAVTAVEWGNLASELLPAHRFDVVIEHAPTGRVIEIIAHGLDEVRVEQVQRALKPWGDER